jgi:hypothetical protein
MQQQKADKRGHNPDMVGHSPGTVIELNCKKCEDTGKLVFAFSRSNGNKGKIVARALVRNARSLSGA